MKEGENALTSDTEYAVAYTNNNAGTACRFDKSDFFPFFICQFEKKSYLCSIVA